MPDFESLGGESRNIRQVIFLGIVVLSTVLTVMILSEEYSFLTAEQQRGYIGSLFWPILTVGGIVATSIYMVANSEYKNKIIVGTLIVLLIVSAYLIREAITFFNVSGFNSALAIGTVYTLIGVLSSVYIAVNIIHPNGMDGFDTVTSEEQDESLFGLDFKWKLLIGFLLVVFTFFYITGTGQAFVQAPNFGLVEFGVLDSQLGNAFVSAVVGGVIETAFFFSILMPVAHGLVFRFTNNVVLASGIGIIATTLIFLQFHTTVYAYSETALLSVGIFGLSNAILLFIFRDAYILKLFHGFNNFFVVLLAVTTFQIVA